MKIQASYKKTFKQNGQEMEGKEIKEKNEKLKYIDRVSCEGKIYERYVCKDKHSHKLTYYFLMLLK